MVSMSEKFFFVRFLLEVGVCSAILYFNDGTYGLNRVFKFLNVKFDLKSSLAFHQKDTKCLKNMLQKDDIKVKKRREKLKAFKKGWIDNIEETPSQNEYLSGGF